MFWRPVTVSLAVKVDSRTARSHADMSAKRLVSNGQHSQPGNSVQGVCRYEVVTTTLHEYQWSELSGSEEMNQQRKANYLTWGLKSNFLWTKQPDFSPANLWNSDKSKYRYMGSWVDKRIKMFLQFHWCECCAIVWVSIPARGAWSSLPDRPG